MSTAQKATSSKKPAAKPISAKPPALEAPPAARSAMDFAVSQLSVPDASKPASNAITETPEFKAALAAELAKASKKKEAKVKVERPPKIQQNGVTRPAPGTACARVWDTADAITAEINGSAPVSLVKATLKDMNDHTIKTQYARWRAFNGIVGRVEMPAGAAEAAEASNTEAE